jgi:peptidase M28-like protein/PDZ domain-containing protein
VIRRALLLPFAVLLLFSSAAAETSTTVVSPRADELLAHVRALTAPEMEGRASGTIGGDRAGQYIADRLQAMGLRPGGDGGSFFQQFAFSTAVAVGPGTLLETLGSPVKVLQVGRDWTPHGGSLAGEVTGEVVFVGYGVVAADRGYDDYAGLDMRGKIALALDGAPAHLPDARPSRLEKLITARRRGASGLLIVGDPLPSLGATGASVRLVSGTVTSVAADQLLGPAGKTAAGLRQALASSRLPASFATGVEARIRVDLQREDRHTSNVIGILPGSDPSRAAEVLVLGAHYDHLGRTGGEVHPGADDNASGTSLVLGLARALAAAGGAPRTLVFALFSGEEVGLLGSAHYARHPTLAIERTVAMLNFDMVGRMRDHRLNVAGVESGIGLRALVMEAGAREPLTLVPHDTPYAPSDQTSFYAAGAPVLFFFTDQHDDYHTPGDTADKINGQGMADIARVALRVVERLAGDTRPTYVKLSPPPPTQQFSGARGGAFLGVAADVGSESDGLRLAAVFPGTAAARAGLQAGDVIIRLDDVPIGSFEELKRMIAKKRPGEAIAVLFLRDGDDHGTTATLDARP